MAKANVSWSIKDVHCIGTIGWRRKGDQHGMVISSTCSERYGILIETTRIDGEA